MIPNLLLAILPPYAVAFVLARMAWRPLSGVWERLLVAGCAFGLGAGISSCTYFLYMAGARPGGGRVFFVEPVFFVCVLACLAAVWAVVTGTRWSPGAADSGLWAVQESRGRIDGVSIGLAVALCAILACAVAGFVLSVMDKPHGAGDATAIWNLRARFMFRGQDLWTRGFSPTLLWSHPDYPLLVPSSVARLWTYLGFDTPRVPQVVAGVFAAAVVGVLVSSLAVLRSVRRGLTAAIFLLATVGFVRLSAWQYADVPLSFFILTSMALLLVGEEGEGRRWGMLALAGAMAGFGAWTKNEGGLFVVALVFAVAVVTCAKRGLRSCARTMGGFAVGLVPVLFVLLFFKVRYAPPNDLFGQAGAGGLISRVVDFHRYAVVAAAFGREALFWGWGLTAVLAVYVAVAGRGGGRPGRVMPLAGGLALAVVVVGYFFVYVLTPHDLVWHLATSLERLFLQLWPAFLLVLFLKVGRDDRRDCERQKA